jgi:hypothetical protein
VTPLSVSCVAGPFPPFGVFVDPSPPSGAQGLDRSHRRPPCCPPSPVSSTPIHPRASLVSPHQRHLARLVCLTSVVLQVKTTSWLKHQWAARQPHHVYTHHGQSTLPRCGGHAMQPVVISSWPNFWQVVWPVELGRGPSFYLGFGRPLSHAASPSRSSFGLAPKFKFQFLFMFQV